MLFWNVPLCLLRSPEIAAAGAEAVGVWVRVMGYGCEQECGGKLRGALRWTERQWLAACNVTKADVNLAVSAGLLSLAGDDVAIWSYPLQRQAGLASLRAEGAAGGSVRSSAKAEAARRNGRLGGRPPGRDTEMQQNRTETEQHPNETQRGCLRGADITSQSLGNNPRERKGKESVCMTTTTHETDEIWISRVRAAWPGVNLDRELRRARTYVQRARGEDAPLQRRWFENEWLPRCADPAAPTRAAAPAADTREPAPIGWKAALAGSVYGEGGIHEATTWEALDETTRKFALRRIAEITH